MYILLFYIMIINNDYKMYIKNLNGMFEFLGVFIGDNLVLFFFLDCVCLFLYSRFFIFFYIIEIKNVFVLFYKCYIIFF